MASSLSSRRRIYSTLRKVSPFLVRQTYITSASLPLPNTRCKSNRSIKSICVSQHRALKALLLMWSSPAALVNVKLSASKLSTGRQSFFSHAAYHLRIVSSFFGLSPVAACALAICGMPAAAASAYGPALSTARRDKVVFLMTHFSLGGRKCTTENQGRASLCDIAGKKHAKADIKGVQIQPPEILCVVRGA